MSQAGTTLPRLDGDGVTRPRTTSRISFVTVPPPAPEEERDDVTTSARPGLRSTPTRPRGSSPRVTPIHRVPSTRPSRTRRTTTTPLSTRPPQPSPSRTGIASPTPRPTSTRGGNVAPEKPRRTSAKRGKRGVDVTTMCLNAIDYSVLRQNLKPKLKRQRLIGEFTAAYQRGLDLFDQEREAELTGLFAQFRESSFVPQRRELLRLSRYVTALRDDYARELHLAESMATAAVQGASRCLASVRAAGHALCTDTNLLDPAASYDVAENCARDEAYYGHGRPMPEVRPVQDVDEKTTAPAATCTTAAASAAQVRTIADYFTPTTLPSCTTALTTLTLLPRLSELVREHYAAATPTPPSESTTGLVGGMADDQQTAVRHRESAWQARMTRVTQLEQAFAQATEALDALLTRMQTRDAHHVRLLARQKRALDEAATRVKLADDVLTGSCAQADTSACYAMARLRELSLELRARVDAVAADVRHALERLLAESAVVCVENGALASEGTIAYRREACVQACRGVLQRGAIESAAVLRAVHDDVIDLWRRTPHAGREEKSTLRHRALPPAHDAALQLCDRDTLIRLLHHVCVHSDDALRLVLGALDEHTFFLQANPAEAVAVRQRGVMRDAVTALLERLDAEHLLDVDATGLPRSLPYKVVDLVRRYDALVHQPRPCSAASTVELGDASVDDVTVAHTAFFHPHTPTPGSVKEPRPDPTSDPRPLAFSPALLTPPCAGATPSKVNVPSPTAVRAYLRRGHPWSQAAAQGMESVVGDGRWGGVMARTTTSKGGEEKLPSIAPPATSAVATTWTSRGPLRPHEHSALTRALEQHAAASAEAPAPSLPVRTHLIAHVRREYQHDPDELIHGTVDAKPPEATKKEYHDEDYYFIDRKRQLYESLFA